MHLQCVLCNCQRRLAKSSIIMPLPTVGGNIKRHCDASVCLSVRLAGFVVDSPGYVGATDPGEKLLIERRPDMRNWTQLQYFLQRDAMHLRTSHGPQALCLSVRPSQVGYDNTIRYEMLF